MNIVIFTLTLACMFARIIASAVSSMICHRTDFLRNAFVCPLDDYKLVTSPAATSQEHITYILYDVNPAEGFNLRRDVYIRMAVFLKYLKNQKGYRRSKLVLPPWSNLFHWRSQNIDQNFIFWHHFFDLDSMKRYTDIIEIYEFFNEWKRWHDGDVVTLNEVYRLQHFEDMFDNGVFVDKFEERACAKNNAFSKGYFGYKNISEVRLSCMNFQGSATLIHKLLERYKPHHPTGIRAVLFMNAETVLHDFWGNVDYWEARRSMRFSRMLTKISDQFRKTYFNSTDVFDAVQRPAQWTQEENYRKAKGGDYLCAHLRRADFLYGREKTTPTIHSAAVQIKNKLLELGLRKIFVTSDCSKSEFHDLKNYLKRFKVVRYTTETFEQKALLKDGGIAIIDQLICSHSRYFIGTYESTFTYRIYEEREILGFPKDRTFNTFCKNEEYSSCEKNSIWPIVY